MNQSSLAASNCRPLCFDAMARLTGRQGGSRWRAENRGLEPVLSRAVEGSLAELAVSRCGALRRDGSNDMQALRCGTFVSPQKQRLVRRVALDLAEARKEINR